VAVAGKDREISKERHWSSTPPWRANPQIMKLCVAPGLRRRRAGWGGRSGGHDRERLEVDVHVVTAPVAVTQNLVTCTNNGHRGRRLVLERLRRPKLSDSRQKEPGSPDRHRQRHDRVAVSEGTIAHTAVVPIGGTLHERSRGGAARAITDAERLKKHGCALRSAVAERDGQVPMVGRRAPKYCSARLCPTSSSRAEGSWSRARRHQAAHLDRRSLRRRPDRRRSGSKASSRRRGHLRRSRAP
jgi:hypothetical protein